MQVGVKMVNGQWYGVAGLAGSDMAATGAKVAAAVNKVIAERVPGERKNAVKGHEADTTVFKAVLSDGETAEAIAEAINELIARKAKAALGGAAGTTAAAPVEELGL